MAEKRKRINIDQTANEMLFNCLINRTESIHGHDHLNSELFIFELGMISEKPRRADRIELI